MGKNIVIFASGTGTNAENIIRYFQKKESATIKLVLSNKKEAQVLERAKKLNVPCRYIPKKDWEKGEEILSLLQSNEIDLIVLAGFLLKVPDSLLEAYPRRIVNIHPALLPKYGGKGMYGNRVHEAVAAAEETETGITIHYINKEYDKGEIISQITCPIQPDDTPEEIASKVHALEYEHYPQVIESLLSTSYL